ncbi:MAG: glycosyltransferase 87 family protein [Flavobacterium sp.]|nr:glycosyltransferase 87 family protein [Flavobacterium sp.]
MAFLTHIKTKYSIWLVLVVITASSVFITSRYFKQGYFQDLRTRITGTRLLDAHKSAYFYKWQLGDDIRLLNFTERQTEIVNGNTVTPIVLLFTNYLHRLAYWQIVVIWYALGYLSLLSILLLIAQKIASHQYTKHQFLFAIACLFPFIVGWRFHCSSGQIYIHYTLLAVASLYAYTKNKKILAAILAGIVTAARLPYIIVFVPLFLFKKNNKMVVPYLAIIIVLCTVTSLTYGTQVWIDYFKAMPFYGFENMGTIPNIRNAFTINLPSYLEGMPTFKTPELVAYERLDTADIFSVQKLLILLHLPSSAAVLYTMYVFVMGLVFLFINKWHTRFYQQQKLFILFAMLLLLLLEYFLPARRYNYNFVQFLVIISVIVFFDIGMSQLAKWLLAIGILLNIFRVSWIPESYSLGEVLCIGAVMLTIIQSRKYEGSTTNAFNVVGGFVNKLLALLP